MGDLVRLLDAEGNIANPQPVTIEDIVEAPGGLTYAITSAGGTGWPLERCEPVRGGSKWQ